MAIKLKTLSDQEHLCQGNLACAGCSQILGLRQVLKVLGENTLVVNTTGCMAVITQMGVPKVPHFHVLFENAAAVASGIDDALKQQGRRDQYKLLVVGGDGGTADIGLASLSGAIERGQDFIYICFDNESYMNTGGQRSGTTPFAARTSTTPVGTVSRGEARLPALRKNMVEIIAAHNIPYAASTAIGYPMDFLGKVEKAAQVRGPSYIHCHAPCPPGWGVDSELVIEASKLAVQTGAVLLYEIENGERRITKKVSKRKPIADYLKLQARFRHILDDEKLIEQLQREVDAGFEALTARC
ncbi:MAG: pyruvate synthase subunit beta [Deltaproteobacteria bacterium]|nr:pyruvate synthase subunit beta [Deltaproteobacteria bacterium]